MGKIYSSLDLAAKRAYSRGIQTGSGGNISMRDPEAEGAMIVKASGGSFADCTDEGDGFVRTDFDGNRFNPEDPKPTREVFLHGLIYKLMPGVNGVVHCHSPWAVAWSF